MIICERWQLHNDVKRGCLGNLSTNKVVGKEVPMGAKEESRDIQEVIDNVNNTWGEEHGVKSTKRKVKKYFGEILYGDP